MRKLVLGAAAAAALLVAPAARSATPVVCMNCSTIAQQLLNYARQLAQLQQEIQTAENTLNFYKNAVQNTASLPGTAYRDITGDIAGIEGIANTASMLGGQTGIMIGNLGVSGGYPIGHYSNFTTQLLAEDNAIANAMTQMANVLNLQPSQLRNDAATLSALQSQAMAATGRQQALQSLAGITATVGQQISKQQGTLTATYQAIATYDTAQADRQAVLDAAAQQATQRELAASCQVMAQSGAGPLPSDCPGAGQ
jgi:P-type conjugative transfer protein TrbJ